MTAPIFQLVAGLITGSLFGVQIMVILALAVMAEAVVSLVLLGAWDGLVWFFTGQVALQMGYLAGVYLRSVLERAGVVVATRPGRRFHHSHTPVTHSAVVNNPQTNTSAIDHSPNTRPLCTG